MYCHFLYALFPQPTLSIPDGGQPQPWEVIMLPKNRFDLVSSLQNRFGRPEAEASEENHFEKLFVRQQDGPLLGIFLQLDFTSLHRYP
jgi:hypothetical protein